MRSHEFGEIVECVCVPWHGCRLGALCIGQLKTVAHSRIFILRDTPALEENKLILLWGSFFIFILGVDVQGYL